MVLNLLSFCMANTWAISPDSTNVEIGPSFMETRNDTYKVPHLKKNQNYINLPFSNCSRTFLHARGVSSFLDIRSCGFLESLSLTLRHPHSWARTESERGPSRLTPQMPGSRGKGSIHCIRLWECSYTGKYLLLLLLMTYSYQDLLLIKTFDPMPNLICEVL